MVTGASVPSAFVPMLRPIYALNPDFVAFTLDVSCCCGAAVSIAINIRESSVIPSSVLSVLPALPSILDFAVSWVVKLSTTLVPQSILAIDIRDSSVMRLTTLYVIAVVSDSAVPCGER